MASYSCKLISAVPAGAGFVTLTIEQRVLAGDADPRRTFSITVPRTATNAEVRALAAANIAAEEATRIAAQAEQADAVGRFGSMIGVSFNATV